MKALYILSILFLLNISFQSCKSTTSLEDTINHTDPPSKMDIYLLIGQSNMAGRAEIEDQDKDTLNNVYLFTSKGGQPWEKAANPLNKYSTIRKKMSMQRLGPAYSFGEKMSATSNGTSIGLVVNAKGGTSIDQWAPNSEFYNEAVMRTHEAMKYGNLKGIAWHQGESDATKHNAYLPKIKNLITAFRQEFGKPDLPFIVGQISPEKSKRFDFNQMILELPNELHGVGVVRHDNTTTTDSTHFDSRSQRLLGERYAIQMLNVMQK